MTAKQMNSAGPQLELFVEGFVSAFFRSLMMTDNPAGRSA